MAPKRVLLVEGGDDEHVVKALCGRHGLPKLEIRNCLGKDSLLESFPIQLRESDIGALGVVVDADEDLAASWSALRDRLEKAGYQGLPELPDPSGTVAEAPARTLLPRVGVWLMPDNRAPGILEDFLSLLVPAASSSLLARANSAIDGIPEEERRFSAAKRPKALIHTWLAWQLEPGRPLGQSITSRILDSDGAEARLFVAWLRGLFETPPG